MIPKRISSAFRTLQKGRLLFLFILFVILPTIPLAYFTYRMLQSIAREPEIVSAAINDHLQRVGRSFTQRAAKPILDCGAELVDGIRSDLSLDDLVAEIGEAEKGCPPFAGFFLLDESLRSLFPFDETGEEETADLLLSARTDDRIVEFSRRMKAGSAKEFVGGNPVEALEEYRAAISNATGSQPKAIAMNAAARCCMKAGRYAEATSFSREILSADEGAISHNGTSLTLLAKQRMAVAEKSRGNAARAADILLEVMGELAEGKLAGSIHEASFHASMALEECTELMNQAELRERYGPPIEKAREQWVRTEAAAMAMGKLRDAWRIDLQRGFEEGARVAGRVETVSRPLGGEDMVMLYRLVTVEGSDRPVLLAVLLNSQALRREMLDILRDAFESEPDVNSTLTDASGTVILSRMSPAGSSRYEVRRAMAPAFPSWKLMLVYRNNGPLLAAEAVERRTWLSYIALLTVIIFMGMHITYRSIRKDSELARLKSDFVSRVSHELRTPLATIRAVGEMLEIGAVSSREKEKEYFSFITSESERLSRLIDNVLDFSRLGAGKKMYHIKPIPLAKTVSATVRAFKQYVTSEGFEILYAADDDIPLVPADEDSISQALINLMDNAVKFSRDEKVVWVELRRRGDEIALRVRDRGIGIAAKDMDKIFSLFYRQDNATTVSSKGAGIGLAIVKSIAEAHGGWVEVQSVPGEGSTFTIVLPIR